MCKILKYSTYSIHTHAERTVRKFLSFHTHKLTANVKLLSFPNTYACTHTCIHTRTDRRMHIFLCFTFTTYTRKENREKFLSFPTLTHWQQTQNFKVYTWAVTQMCVKFLSLVQIHTCVKLLSHICHTQICVKCLSLVYLANTLSQRTVTKFISFHTVIQRRTNVKFLSLNTQRCNISNESEANRKRIKRIRNEPEANRKRIKRTRNEPSESTASRKRVENGLLRIANWSITGRNGSITGRNGSKTG